MTVVVRVMEDPMSATRHTGAMNEASRWAVELLSLARPFGDMDVAGALSIASTLLGSPIHSLAYAREGDKRSHPLRGNSLDALPDWRGCLSIAGEADNGSSVYLDLWRLSRSARLPQASGYRSHRFRLEFPADMLAGRHVEDVLQIVVDMAAAFGTTYGIMRPLRDGAPALVARTRGLEEGIPGVWEITVLGGAFRSVVDAEALRTYPRVAAICSRGHCVGFSLIGDWDEALPDDAAREIRSLIGNDYFAAPVHTEARSADVAAGKFFVGRVRSLFDRIVEDRKARARSSKYRFKHDWSGLRAGRQ